METGRQLRNLMEYGREEGGGGRCEIWQRQTGKQGTATREPSARSRLPVTQDESVGRSYPEPAPSSRPVAPDPGTSPAGMLVGLRGPRDLQQARRVCMAAARPPCGRAQAGAPAWFAGVSAKVALEVSPPSVLLPASLPGPAGLRRPCPLGCVSLALESAGGFSRSARPCQSMRRPVAATPAQRPLVRQPTAMRGLPPSTDGIDCPGGIGCLEGIRRLARARGGEPPPPSVATRGAVSTHTCMSSDRRPLGPTELCPCRL